MTAAQIIREVAHAHNLTIEQIRGPSRKPHLVVARREIATRLATERNLTGGQIGMFLHRSIWSVRYYLDPEYRERNIAKGKAWFFARRERMSAA